MRRARKRDRRYWIRFFSIYLLAVIVALYVIVPIGLAFYISYPLRQAVCCASPADFGLTYETVTFLSSDGVKLSGWYIPSQNGAAIIAVHANGGNRTGVLYHADVLAKHGYGVLLFDVRGFGDSEGGYSPYPKGGMAEDVLGAVTYLQSRPDVEPDRIGALGLSMGALIVLRAAALTDDVKAVMADGADEQTATDLQSLMPAPLYYLYVGPIYRLTLWLIGVETETPGPLISKVIADIAPRPVFLIGSGSTAEIEDNQLFYELAGDPKTLWELPDSPHIGGIFSHAQEYHQRMLTFFDQALLETH